MELDMRGPHRASNPVSRTEGRRVDCPACQAPAGENCLRRNGDVRTSNHMERVKLYVRTHRT